MYEIKKDFEQTVCLGPLMFLNPGDLVPAEAETKYAKAYEHYLQRGVKVKKNIEKKVSKVENRKGLNALTLKEMVMFAKSKNIDFPEGAERKEMIPLIKETYKNVKG